MASAKKKSEKDTGREHPTDIEALPALTEEELAALHQRIEHMFKLHTNNPLMRKIEQIAQQLVTEGRIRG